VLVNPRFGGGKISNEGAAYTWTHKKSATKWYFSASVGEWRINFDPEEFTNP